MDAFIKYGGGFAVIASAIISFFSCIKSGTHSQQASDASQKASHASETAENAAKTSREAMAIADRACTQSLTASEIALSAVTNTMKLFQSNTATRAQAEAAAAIAELAAHHSSNALREATSAATNAQEAANVATATEIAIRSLSLAQAWNAALFDSLDAVPPETQSAILAREAELEDLVAIQVHLAAQGQTFDDPFSADMRPGAGLSSSNASERCHALLYMLAALASPDGMKSSAKVEARDQLILEAIRIAETDEYLMPRITAFRVARQLAQQVYPMAGLVQSTYRDEEGRKRFLQQLTQQFIKSRQLPTYH